MPNKHGDMHFFYCKHCGNLIGVIHHSGVPIICCGEPMTALNANTADAAQEKHVPAVTVEGSRVSVSVGSMPHPMADEHHISWVYLQTDRGGQRKMLTIGGDPKVEFAITQDEHPVAAYAYCNLHSLWKKDL